MCVFVLTCAQLASCTYTWSASRCGGAPPARSGAYPAQSGDGRGVPRADVRVERRRTDERLRTEAARGPRRRRKGLARFGSHILERTRVRLNTQKYCMSMFMCVCVCAGVCNYLH